MIIVVIRHGESEADLLDVHEGRADFELTVKGHRQAIEMSKYLKEHYSINRIYSSTLKRASQTANHLSMEYNVPVCYEADLMEFNNGLLAGLSRDVAKEKYPEVLDCPINQAYYGQESMITFRERANQVLSKIINQTKDDETIAIVSHGGMINQLYHSFLGLDIRSNIIFGTGDTGIHVWKIVGHSKRIIKGNLCDHTIGIE